MMAQNQYWQANPAADFQPEYSQWPTASLQYQYPVPGKCRLLPVDFSYYSNPANDGPAYSNEAAMHPCYQPQPALPCRGSAYGDSLVRPGDTLGGMPGQAGSGEYHGAGMTAEGGGQCYQQLGYHHWNMNAYAETVHESAAMPVAGPKRQGSMRHSNPLSMGYAGWQYHPAPPRPVRIPRTAGTAYLHRFDSASSSSGRSFRAKPGHPYLQNFQACDQSAAEQTYQRQADECDESPESLPSNEATSTCASPCTSAAWLDADLDPNQDAASPSASGVSGLIPASSERLREPRKKKLQPLRSLGVRRSLSQAFAKAAHAESEAAAAALSPGTPSSALEQRTVSQTAAASCQEMCWQKADDRDGSADVSCGGSSFRQPIEEAATSSRRWLDALVNGRASGELGVPAAHGRIKEEPERIDRQPLDDAGEVISGRQEKGGGEMSLRHFLDVNARVSAADARAIVVNVAYALQRLHEDGLLFRNVCPENIVLGDAACVSTARLGQGVDVALCGVLQSFTDCQSIGDPAYRPPEDVLSKGLRFTSTPAGDVWSLGIVLCELLSGRRPFSAQALILAASVPDCPMEQLQSCLTRCLQREAASWPPGALDLVSSMLQVDPVLRPSAAQILEHPWLQALTPNTQNSSQQIQDIEEDWATVDLVSTPNTEARLAVTETALQQLLVEPVDPPATPPSGARPCSATCILHKQAKGASGQPGEDGKPNGVILNWVQHLFKRSRKADPCFSGRAAGSSSIQRQATW